MNSIFRRAADRTVLIAAATAAIGLLLRAEYLREYGGSPLFGMALGPDVAEYDARAREILRGCWAGERPDLHAPLYSFFLALTYAAGGFSVPAARYVQTAINWIAWILFYRFLRRRSPARDPVPECFLAAAMFYPALFYHQAELISESLLLPALLLSVAAMRKADESSGLLPALVRCALGGLAAGLAAITHPSALAFAAAETLRCLLLRRRAAAAVFCCSALLPVLPVSWIQSRLAGRPVLIQSNGAFNLYLGHNPEADGGCYLRPGPAWRRRHRIAEETARRRGVSADRVHLERVAGFVIRSPAAELKLLAHKALLIFAPTELPAGADVPALFYATPTQRLFSSAGTALLIVLAASGLGVAGAVRGRRRLLTHPLLLGASCFAFQLLTVTSGRYRIGMFPALFMLAAAGMPLRRRRRRLQNTCALAGALLTFASLAVVPDRSGTAGEAVSLTGEALFRLNRGQEAAGMLIANLGRSSDFARDANLIGEIRRSAGRRDEAAEWYRAAARRDPDDAFGMMNLGALFLERKDYRRAARCFTEAHRRSPELAEPVYDLALALDLSGDAAGAASIYRRLLRIHPRHRQSLNALGVLELRAGDCAGAARLFRAALALDPGHEGVRRNLRTAEAELERRRSADRLRSESVPQRSGLRRE